jgi:hypothetical protein
MRNVNVRFHFNSCGSTNDSISLLPGNEYVCCRRDGMKNVVDCDKNSVEPFEECVG